MMIKEIFIIVMVKKDLKIKHNIMVMTSLGKSYTTFYNDNTIHRSFFGGGFGFHFGQTDSGPREIPRGGTITMDIEVYTFKNDVGYNCIGR